MESQIRKSSHVRRKCQKDKFSLEFNFRDEGCLIIDEILMIVQYIKVSFHIQRKTFVVMFRNASFKKNDDNN